jgi:tRNA pseudouridine38-40 synthase
MIVAYRGTHFHGWQRQMPLPTFKGKAPPPGHGIPTVQETLARAMAKVLNHRVIITGSSRTDRGVHAKAQMAHFDTDQTQIPPEGMRMAINHKLPDEILIRSIEPVPKNFDAIQAAQTKRYQYFVWNALNRNPFAHDLSWHKWQPLNVEAMKQAAPHLEGEHDFTSFCRPGHGRQTAVRTINCCSVANIGPKIVLGIEGTGFLWNMVRIIVGTLVEVGLGIYSPNDIPKMLAAKDRRAAGSTAPPEGLYLQWIKIRPELNFSPSRRK